MKRHGRQSGAHPDNPGLADIIERNIDTMADVRAAEQERSTLQDRLADGLTGEEQELAGALAPLGTARRTTSPPPSRPGISAIWPSRNSLPGAPISAAPR